MSAESWSRSAVLGGRDLHVILAAAVVQGWSLYALHYSVNHAVWPATSSGWLITLYAVAAVAPLTVQMLAAHVHRPLTWIVIASLTAFYALVGWYYGTNVFDDSRALLDQWPEVGIVLVIQWLLIVPFVQARLLEGHWRSRYQLLFACAWNNKLLLAEAIAFTGLFWLLLMLWSQLFHMLGIDFFRELFQEPIFVYPVTSIVFGIALKLIGSVEGLTRVVLEQTLNVLKWLALLAGVILTLFTLALAAKLPVMIASGERAIGAAWLLWLVAVTILLVNAAYRDGSVAKPYPRPIAFALRCVIPLTIIIALTAIYALSLRIESYGFTVSRVWACIVATAALIYSVGYALAARDRQQWMGGIARVNVFTALYLIAAITLALTPVLSPYRIAANSQYALALRTAQSRTEPGYFPQMEYLRFESGRYGRARLDELSRIDDHPQAALIRTAATSMLASKDRHEARRIDRSAQLADIVLKPDGRHLDAALLELLQKDPAMAGASTPDARLTGIFIDLNDDQKDEFVLLLGSRGALYRHEQTWMRVGTLSPVTSVRWKELEASIDAGEFHARRPKWNELVVGGAAFRADGQ